MENRTPSPSRFITIEGIDGCGKSTQAGLLAEWLSGMAGADNVVRTFEPGGFRKEMRDIVLASPLCARSELLLFLADRIEHLHNVILPSLREGRWVVCERYTDSTLVYQSFAGGIPLCEAERLFSWCEFPVPDLTIFLDVPIETAAARLGARGNRDRIENAGAEFTRGIYEGYRKLSLERKRIVTADAAADERTVAGRVRRIVEERFELKG